MKYLVSTTQDAEKEILEIRNYIINHFYSVTSANNVTLRIRKGIDSLTEYHNYPVVGTKGFKEVRKMRVGKHYVFFTVVEETKTIHVLHVIHTLRNWQDIV